MRAFGMDGWDKSRPDGFSETRQVWLEASGNQAE